VVFLLLIFFILAGKFSAIDPIEVDPPHSVSEGVIGQRELVIVMGVDGQLACDGVLMDKSTLIAALVERLKGNTTPQVWLKADGGADSTQVIRLMEVLREAGVERLKLLTIPTDTTQTT